MQKINLYLQNKWTMTLLLALILFIATFLRLYRLDSVPPSPDWDEAALGYNAYSIMQTGRDEYGKFLPAVLQSFDDYKPALYVYLVIPAIALFDITLFAVRLPSAIFGVLTVLATYFLIEELFKRKDLALVATFLLAISPWHIQFSHIAFEANVGLAFNIFSVLFFLKSFKKPWLLSLATLFMGLNLSVYQSDRLFTPLLALALLLIYKKNIFSLPKKYLVGAVIIGFIVTLPFLQYLLVNKQALARAKGVSITSEQTTQLKASETRFVEDKTDGNLIGVILNNKRVVFGSEILAGYLSHYDLNWLFIRGDLLRHHAPAMGLMYLWELPFLFIGIYQLLFGSYLKKTKALVFAWFLLAPVPAAFTNGVPHAVRTLNFLPTFEVFVAIGFVSSCFFINQKGILGIKHYGVKIGFLILFILFVAFNFVYYLNQYFVQQNYFNSEQWQYGYKQAVDFVKKNDAKYTKVIVSDQIPLDQSYMFFLFYLKYPPILYQQVNATGAGFRENHQFGKFEFRPIDWDKEIQNPTILYIGRPDDFSRHGLISNPILEKINSIDDKPVIQIVGG